MIQTTADTFELPAALPLEDGGLLMHAKLAYETYGRFSADRAVILLHDLPHSHQALGEGGTSIYQPSGWARELVGEGRLLSPRDHYLVSVNLLGSPFGSTSPASLDEDTGKPLGPIFPQITVLDMARAVSGLVRGLNLTRVHAVVGVGLGGMVALRLAALFRDLVRGVVVIGAARALPEGLREQLSMTGQLLGSDPAHQDGNYPPGQGPKRTLRNLRYDFLLRASGDPAITPETAAGKQLAAEADAFAERFDPNCYALLAGAMGRADLSDYLERIRSRVLLVANGTDGMAPVSRVRDTYHLLTAAGAMAHFYELPSEAGHATQPAGATRLHGAMDEFLSML
ncbi:MAG: alpha/beta fold hydrolase [Myxococcota bacterium]|nr:alpha/beta fold hydrolase [Myxococcota bacterium]